MGRFADHGAGGRGAIPFTLIAVFIVAVAGSSVPVLVMVLGVAYWEQYARLIRAQTLSVQTSLFVTASRSMGATKARIALRHILPNIVSPLVVMFTLNFSNIILLESTLSFLGLGVQPPTASLGSMIGQGRSYMADAWWLVAVPSFFVILIALVILLLGDWLGKYSTYEHNDEAVASMSERLRIKLVTDIHHDRRRRRRGPFALSS